MHFSYAYFKVFLNFLIFILFLHRLVILFSVEDRKHWENWAGGGEANYNNTQINIKSDI